MIRARTETTAVRKCDLRSSRTLSSSPEETPNPSPQIASLSLSLRHDFHAVSPLDFLLQGDPTDLKISMEQLKSSCMRGSSSAFGARIGDPTKGRERAVFIGGMSVRCLTKDEREMADVCSSSAGDDNSIADKAIYHYLITIKHSLRHAFPCKPTA